MYFSITDGIFGRIFYMATGFHGFHVFLGLILLVIAMTRLILFRFSSKHHVGLEASLWYWHFVDVVWIFLFLIVYVLYALVFFN